MTSSSARRIPTYSVQAAMGMLMGVLMALSLEPRRPWRFLLIAGVGAILIVSYEYFRGRTTVDAAEPRVRFGPVLFALTWGLTAFMVTIVRLAA